MLKVSVLGDLMVASGRSAVEFHQQKLRVLVCSLVIDAGEFVPVDVLEDRLWGEHRPSSSRKLIQTYVSKIRSAAGEAGKAAITTSGSRYRLSFTDADIDIRRFETSSAAGAHALDEGRFGEAAAIYRQALLLWRGHAYADVADAPWAQPEAVRLQEERLVAHERRIEAELHLGHHQDVVPELLELVLLHPLRESFCALLMVALYRSQRQAEALQAFRVLREQLVDDLGIEPSRRLCRLEQAVLAHAPELTAPALRLRHAPGD